MGFPNDRAVTQPAIWRRSRLFRYSGQRRSSLAGVHAPRSIAVEKGKTKQHSIRHPRRAARRPRSWRALRLLERCPPRPRAPNDKVSATAPSAQGWLVNSYRQIERPAASAIGAEQAALKAMAAKRKPEDIARFQWWGAGGAVYRWNEMIFDKMQLGFVTLPLSVRHLALFHAALMPSPQPGTTRGLPPGWALSSCMMRSRPAARGRRRRRICRRCRGSCRDAGLLVSGARRRVRGQGRGRQIYAAWLTSHPLQARRIVLGIGFSPLE